MTVIPKTAVLLREGRIPEDWQDKPAKLSHKDRHARWTLKFTKAKRQEDGSMVDWRSLHKPRQQFPF